MIKVPEFEQCNLDADDLVECLSIVLLYTI